MHNISTTPTPGLAMPEPRFSYRDIVTNSMQAIQTHAVISSNAVLFQTQPQLKALAKKAIELAVQEWLPPVLDRSVKIALQTCEAIIRKDFALEPDEEKMRIAAHLMVSDDDMMTIDQINFCAKFGNFTLLSFSGAVLKLSPTWGMVPNISFLIFDSLNMISRVKNI